MRPGRALTALRALSVLPCWECSWAASPPRTSGGAPSAVMGLTVFAGAFLIAAVCLFLGGLAVFVWLRPDPLTGSGGPGAVKAGNAAEGSVPAAKKVPSARIREAGAELRGNPRARPAALAIVPRTDRDGVHHDDDPGAHRPSGRHRDADGHHHQPPCSRHVRARSCGGAGDGPDGPPLRDRHRCADLLRVASPCGPATGRHAVDHLLPHPARHRLVVRRGPAARADQLLRPSVSSPWSS
jgi:hypothetical protein